MLHELTWAQIILFEIGALFQFIALCTFLRERWEDRNHSDSHHHNHDYDDAGEEAPRRPHVTTAQHVSAYHIMPAPHRDSDDQPSRKMSAAHLAKTAKVKFKQTFKSLRHD